MSKLDSSKSSYQTFSFADSETASDNHVLTISKKTKTVFLPYTKLELEEYHKQHPNDYNSYSDIIKREFVMPLSSFTKDPIIARFREGYSLIRDKEMKSFFEAFKFGLGLMFHHDLNPVIIPSCKSEDVLNDYLECLEQKKTEDFKAFEIKFEVSTLK